ncbi:MAG: response regulator transcription factor [Brooklawnia sp.]|uniref:winged helix-turn-helix domain-containing protein n=1 Tax=Brooklawnia sp. TaxID=2699740 RepID=UPI003C75C121
MAQIVFVTPRGTPVGPPPAMELLSHKLIHVTGGDAVAEHASQVSLVLVDARTDLVAARTACLVIHAGADLPVLLLVPAAGLSVVGVDWRMDDFVLADAEPAEFEARIRLLLQAEPVTKTLSAGPVVVDEDAYFATVGGQPLDLTYTEFELLKYLVAHPGRVLTREQLLSEVWGYDYFGGARTVDVHIRRLRAKLGPEYDAWIGTVRNVGYRFGANR